MNDSVVNALDDLRCSRCEYQLRGLSANALCPECGFPISQSIASLVGFGEVAATLRTLASGYLIAACLPGMGSLLKLLFHSLGFGETMKLRTIGESSRFRNFGKVGLTLCIVELFLAVIVMPMSFDSSDSLLWFSLLAIAAIELGCLMLTLRIAAEIASQIQAAWIGRSLLVLHWVGPLVLLGASIGGVYGALYETGIAIASTILLPLPIWILMSLTLYQLAAAVKPRESIASANQPEAEV